MTQKMRKSRPKQKWVAERYRNAKGFIYYRYVIKVIQNIDNKNGDHTDEGYDNEYDSEYEPINDEDFK